MKKFLFLILVFVLMGCTSLQKSAIKVGEIDLKNAEVAREVGKNLLSTWKLNSGFIRGSLGDAINQFPHEAVKAMDELDKLAAKENPDDFDLGYSLGARVRLAGEIIVQAIKHYFPKLLEYITLPF
jgi:hypothetical protein